MILFLIPFYLLFLCIAGVQVGGESELMLNFRACMCSGCLSSCYNGWKSCHQLTADRRAMQMVTHQALVEGGAVLSPGLWSAEVPSSWASLELPWPHQMMKHQVCRQTPTSKPLHLSIIMCSVTLTPECSVVREPVKHFPEAPFSACFSPSCCHLKIACPPSCLESWRTEDPRWEGWVQVGKQFGILTLPLWCSESPLRGDHHFPSPL